MTHLPAGRKAVVLTVICAFAGEAAAESRHAVYLELLGKGGLWGAGYDYQATPRLAFGAVGSYYVLGGDQFATLSPYVAAYPIGRGHHRWFVQVGPQLVRRRTPSPVAGWRGMTTIGAAAEISTGYEYRDRILVRAFAMAAIGDRVAPWIGLSLGWTF